jgi:general secretion pathway protein I
MIYFLSLPNKKAGFSLLEVILALGILLGAIAVLGELARLGMHNAKMTQDLTRAQLLCRSKMAEITSGITTPDAVSQGTFDEIYQDSNIPWIYSVETQQIDQDGLIAVRVRVSQNLPAPQRPVSCSLLQWMIDPNTETSTSSTSNTSTTSTSGTSTTSAN